MKLENLYTETRKYLLIAGTFAITLSCGMAIQKNDGSIRVSDSILEMNIGEDTTNETADFTFDKNENENKGLVIEEKIAIDPIYVFSSTNELKYNKDNIVIKIEPKDDCEDYGTIEKGSEISILGYNEFGYAKISYDNQELYIKNENLTDNKNEIFFDCNSTMYTSENIEVYDSIYAENAVTTVEKYSEISVIGENESEYSFVQVGDTQGYVLKEKLLKYLPKEAYIKHEDSVDYYTNNMYSGVLAEVDDSQKTEENIVFLAKLIHCEAGGQTEAGKLAVATVVVNRAYDGEMGSTIRGVIERQGQFSPVSSGAIYNASYTDSDYAAAKKVLIDGYRSFPAYVLYFQSIRDGYFGGQSTYCVCYTASKTSPQYFSYKTSDLNKYKR